MIKNRNVNEIINRLILWAKVTIVKPMIRCLELYFSNVNTSMIPNKQIGKKDIAITSPMALRT